MKQKKWIFFAIVLVLGSLTFVKVIRKPSRVELKSITLVKDKKTSSGSDKAAEAQTDERTPNAHSATPSTSVADMSKALKKFTAPGNKLKDLVQFLKDTHQDPQVSHDANPDTGEMAIVRTRTPLPGTRYFHAQYFSDGNDDGFVQHMSFEVQPSPTAMNDTVAAVSQSFGLQQPNVERDGYKKWKMPNGYIVWVKRMGDEDLIDDPFNAYSANDVGTIRVAIESDIHSED